ncbi:MAG: Sulfotransferase family [Actinomycetota bacterium]|nr:Sulfotransferase family [Actinomycetota bacterium]
MNCVIGHPRSGTQLMSRVLNATGDEHCRHEYLFRLSSMCVSIPTEYYAGRAAADEVDRLLRHYDFTPSPWVEIDSNWKLTWILPVFLKRFPAAKVVHLTRDPRPNVRSCQNLDFYGDLHRHPAHRKRRYWWSWMPEVRRPDWDELSPFERNCAFWTETHRLAFDALAGHPHRLQIRLEDVGDRRTRATLFDFFGLPHPTRVQEARSVRRRVNHRTEQKAQIRRDKPDALPDHAEWPQPLQRRLVELCGETAHRLGYAI